MSLSSRLWVVKRKDGSCFVKLVTNYDIIFDMCKHLSTNRVRNCKSSINRTLVIHPIMELRMAVFYSTT